MCANLRFEGVGRDLEQMVPSSCSHAFFTASGFTCIRVEGCRKVDIRLPEKGEADIRLSRKGNSNSHGAIPVH